MSVGGKEIGVFEIHLAYSIASFSRSEKVCMLSEPILPWRTSISSVVMPYSAYSKEFISMQNGHETENDV